MMSRAAGAAACHQETSTSSTSAYVRIQPPGGGAKHRAGPDHEREQSEAPGEGQPASWAQLRHATDAARLPYPNCWPSMLRQERLNGATRVRRQVRWHHQPRRAPARGMSGARPWRAGRTAPHASSAGSGNPCPHARGHVAPARAGGEQPRGGRPDRARLPAWSIRPCGWRFARKCGRLLATWRTRSQGACSATVPQQGVDRAPQGTSATRSCAVWGQLCAGAPCA